MLVGAERLLWEASERALRQPRGLVALVLHLSRLTPPAPRSYHSRIARVLMVDSAARFDGQVFAMRNQDLVLLCRTGTMPCQVGSASPGSHMPWAKNKDPASDPKSLPGLLGKLFSADADPAKLTSLWHLDGDAPLLLGYLSERANGPAFAEGLDKPTDAVLSVGALQGILAKAPLGDLIQRRIGMSLDPDRGKCLADRLLPAFHELELSLEALNLGPLVSCATADPFLLCHLASGIDQKLVKLLADDLNESGGLTRASIQAQVPVHLNLDLATILSPDFKHLSDQAAAKGVRLGASISLMQACTDLDLVEHARRILTLMGAELILSDVDPIALAIARPAVLRPDIIKVIWSPTLLTSADYKNTGRSTSPFDGMTITRIVLQNTDSQQALAWGQSRGITRFQGAFIDQIQAATRMTQCSAASHCTMRQCTTRAGSASITGRAGCSNQRVLDAGFRAREEALVLC